MSIRDSYRYLFYKIYKFWQVSSVPEFWTDWKAALTIDFLWIFVSFSLVAYYTAISRNPADFLKDEYIIVAYFVLIVLPNYFFFHHRDQWKLIIKEFDEWPEKKNQKGTLLVVLVLLILIVNFIFSFYLLNQIGPLYGR